MRLPNLDIDQVEYTIVENLQFEHLMEQWGMVHYTTLKVWKLFIPIFRVLK